MLYDLDFQEFYKLWGDYARDKRGLSRQALEIIFDHYEDERIEFHHDHFVIYSECNWSNLDTYFGIKDETTLVNMDVKYWDLGERVLLDTESF